MLYHYRDLNETYTFVKLNYDGYIDKKEFKWMTSNKVINNKTIDIVFKVRTQQIKLGSSLRKTIIKTVFPTTYLRI